MSVSRARAVAFDVLWRVEAEGAYASDVLHTELTGTRIASTRPTHAMEITAQDAALATELTLGVLRWRALLDFLLARQLKKPRGERARIAGPRYAMGRLDLPVAIALRMGLYQLLFLERVPPRAAVNESVELVKRARKASAASLVNAVLRRAAKENGPLAPGGSVSTNDRPLAEASAQSVLARGAVGGVIAAAEKLLPPSLPPAERLGTLYSHPAWLVERWLARFGEQRTIAVLDANNRAPRLTCSIRDINHRDEIIAGLAKSGLRVEPGALLKNAIAVSGGSVSRTEAFQRGEISIQDEASQLIPLLLGARAGDQVLDLCAAPGGKTPALARAAGQSGLVIAADRHAHRLRAMRAQFGRLGISRIGIVELDAEQPLPFRSGFDRILLDAPCSGTGTLARHPEIRWRLKREQLGEFHRLQSAILSSALDVLAPGGRLAYSTCSLEDEENQDVTAETLKGRSDIRIIAAHDIAQLLSPHLVPGINLATLFDASGYFRTIPGSNPSDGFFAAVFQKRT
jgi:16S rRNA (cytosine967-C5)-methyltransferase